MKKYLTHEEMKKQVADFRDQQRSERKTIDDATHEEWTEEQRRRWYAKSATIEGDSAVGAGFPPNKRSLP